MDTLSYEECGTLTGRRSREASDADSVVGWSIISDEIDETLSRPAVASGRGRRSIDHPNGISLRGPATRTTVDSLSCR